MDKIKRLDELINGGDDVDAASEYYTLFCRLYLAAKLYLDQNNVSNRARLRKALAACSDGK